MSDDQVTWFGATNGRVTAVMGLASGLVVLLIGVFQASAAGTRGTDLVLRGIVSTVVVPLASVENIALRQVLAVWADGRRYVSAAVGHTYREINRQRRGGGQVEEVGAADSKYAEQVLELITERGREARRDGAPMGPAHREWAWLEIGALVALLVAFVVSLGL